MNEIITINRLCPDFARNIPSDERKRERERGVDRQRDRNIENK